MEMKDGFLIVSVHDFKTNLSRYLRLLQQGGAKAIVVRRYNKRLAMLIPMHALKSRPSGAGAATPAPSKNVDLVHQH